MGKKKITWEFTFNRSLFSLGHSEVHFEMFTHLSNLSNWKFPRHEGMSMHSKELASSPAGVKEENRCYQKWVHLGSRLLTARPFPSSRGGRSALGTSGLTRNLGIIICSLLPPLPYSRFKKKSPSLNSSSSSSLFVFCTCLAIDHFWK